MCGCLALVQAFAGNLDWAAYLVGIALVLDFFDGFVARMLNVTSAIGKDLDSLADMVTFGVVPGVVMFQLISMCFFSEIIIDDVPAKEGWTIYPPEYKAFGVLWSGFRTNAILAYFAFIIPIFSAIRLAKFNNDIRQRESFIGLPTPANAVFICSIPLILNTIESESSIVDFLNNPYILLTATCLLSFLLVSPIPLFALKFKDFGFKGNEIRYIFLAISLLLLVFLQFVGIPLIVLFYIVLSVLNNLIKKS